MNKFKQPKKSPFALISLILLYFNACLPDPPELRNLSIDYSTPTFLDQEINTTFDQSNLSSSRDLNMTMIPDGSWPVLRGLWRINHRTTLRSELPVILVEVETVVDAILLAEITQEDDLLWLHYQVCDVRMESTPAFNHTILPDSFLSALPYRTRRAQLIKRDGNWWFEVPQQYELRGLAREFPNDLPLPSSSEDVWVFDQDRDGVPGLTARLVGFPEGEVSLIQRSWDAWSGEIQIVDYRAESISGSIEWGDEQRIIEASSEVLTVDVRRWIPTDPTLHQFQMQRIDQFECPPRQAPPVPDR